MTRTHYEAGDQIDAISCAGEAQDVYEQDDILASVFTREHAYYVPIIYSATPGSGKLDAFLDALVAWLPDKPVVFVNVINGRLSEHLSKRGFRVVEFIDGEPYPEEL